MLWEKSTRNLKLKEIKTLTYTILATLSCLRVVRKR